MHALSKYEIWYGRDGLPPECTALRAGPLTLEFEEGDLRYIRLGQQELVRRVYVGIRDHNWNTIPGKLSGLKVDAANDRFTVTFDSSHRAGSLQFDWRATITGSSDGAVTYVMDGVARSAFRYCRIGFCVLHPIRECAGRPYRAQTPAGPVAGDLPLLIGPQLIEDGLETPLFPACSALTIALDGGLEVSTEFEGDLFEMEDQRNWTDGSFKTYCTPISLGYPHQASEGEAFHQKVTIKAGPVPADVPAPAATGAGGAACAELVEAASAELVEAASAELVEAARLTLGEPLGHGLSEIGFGVASHGGDLTPREVGLLSALRPAHLKAELHFRDPRWVAELNRAIAEARQIGTRLELAVFLDGDTDAALESFRDLLAGAPLARLLVFHESEASLAATSPRWVQLVRANLERAFPNLAIGGGTNGNFAELNRAWPDTSGMDVLSFTINPQVHAADERSLVEALEPQESTVLTARANCGRLPVCVSSVTLKPPFNQAATEEEEPPDPNELPPSVDPRQMSLFAAAWTVGSIRALTAGGAASVTYYETTGWRGLLETERGSPLPDRFRSTPGMVFPVYHVFADLAEVADAEAVATVSSDPLSVQGLALRREGRWRVLVASLLSSTQQVTVGPFHAGLAAVRRLNDGTARLAMFEPERFRELRGSLPLSGGELVLALGPYETVCLDIEE